MKTNPQKTNFLLIFVLVGVIILLGGVFAVMFHQKEENNVNTHTQVESLPDIYHTSQLYGVNVDMSEVLPTSQHYIKNSKGQDLIDIAHTLGITVFRITSVTKSFSDYSPYTKEQWDTVLNKMAQNNIRALILVESPVEQGDFIKGVINKDQYLSLLHNLIINSGVGKNPDVVAIDLKNEPILNEDNLSLLKQARNIVKKAYPQMPVTVGGWRQQLAPNVLRWNEPMDAAVLDPVVDFYSIHIYGYDRPTNGVFPDPVQFTNSYFWKIQNFLGVSKPIFISEFGAGNGESFTDQETLGSLELQATVYKGVYQAIIDETKFKIFGSTAFDFIARNKNADGWALLSPDANTQYLSISTISQFVNGEQNTPAMKSLLVTSLPTTTILSISDNGKIIQTHVGDVIGLALKMDSGKYTVQLSDPSLVSITQPLYYDGWGRKKYYLVLHTMKSGVENITIGNFKIQINISN